MVTTNLLVLMLSYNTIQKDDDDMTPIEEMFKFKDFKGSNMVLSKRNRKVISYALPFET